MRRLGCRNLLLSLAVAALACACRSVEGPIARRDAMGRIPTPDSPDSWRYVIDSEVQAVATPAEVAGVALPAGMRASVVENPGIRGTAEAHAAVEDVPVAIPVGEAVWENVAYKSPATLDPTWTGAHVAVEWVVVVHRRGASLVEVEVVPRLLHGSGRIARLDEFRVVRRVTPDEAIVISLDAAHPGAESARALFGARAAAFPSGAPLRLALRVRGGA